MQLDLEPSLMTLYVIADDVYGFSTDLLVLQGVRKQTP